MKNFLLFLLLASGLCAQPAASENIQHMLGTATTRGTSTGAIGTVWNVKYAVGSNAFGAKGDGVTDDTAALNAVAAAVNTAGGGIVYLPAGTYLTTNGLVFTTSNVSVYGDGVGVSIIKVTAYADGIRFAAGYPNPTAIISNVTVRDLSVNGNYYGAGWTVSSDTYGNGINLNGTQNFFVHHCSVYGTSGQGIVSTFADTSGGSQIQAQGSITDCIVNMDAATVGLIGIGVEGQFSHVVVSGNTVTCTTATGGVDGVYVGDLGPTTGVDNRGCVISNNVLIGQATSGNGILIEENWRAVTVHGNTIQFFDNSIRLDTNASSALIAAVSGNVCRDWNSYGILFFPNNSGNLQGNASGNTIWSASANANAGILLSTGCVATGNLVNVATPSSGGIYAQDGCQITGNNIQTGSNASLDLAGSVATTVVSDNYLSGIISNPTKCQPGINYGPSGPYTFGAGTGLTVGTKIKGLRTVTGSFAFGTITAGSNAATNVTVTGVSQGDTVIMNWTDGGSNGAAIIIDASVSATNNVLVAIWNPTSGSIVVGTRPYRLTIISY